MLATQLCLFDSCRHLVLWPVFYFVCSRRLSLERAPAIRCNTEPMLLQSPIRLHALKDLRGTLSTRRFDRAITPIALVCGVSTQSRITSRRHSSAAKDANKWARCGVAHSRQLSEVASKATRRIPRTSSIGPLSGISSADFASASVSCSLRFRVLRWQMKNPPRLSLGGIHPKRRLRPRFTRQVSRLS